MKYEKRIYGELPSKSTGQVIVSEIGLLLSYCRYCGFHTAVIRFDESAKAADVYSYECWEITTFDDKEKAKDWAELNYPDDGVNRWFVIKDYQIIHECS